MTTRGFLVAALIGLGAACAGPGSSPDTFQPRQVIYAYAPPADPSHRSLSERLQANRVLERLTEFLSPLRLPRPLTLEVTGCDGDANAYYEDAVVTVCYEYLEYLLENVPERTTATGLTPQQALLGPTIDVFLHEVGHAVFDLLTIPVFGREEDAADQFSNYILLQFSEGDRRVLIYGAAYLADKETRETQGTRLQLDDFADEHGLPGQRYFNLLCLAYGSDPTLFADAIERGGLPKERAEGCADEYAQVHHAFQTLIAPHIDRNILAQVRAERVLTANAAR